MKSILILLFLTIHLVGTLSAQEERHVFYYLLNIGDVWEYRRSPGFLDTRKVIGDTLLPNGKTYRVIERMSTGRTHFLFKELVKRMKCFYQLSMTPVKTSSIN